MRCTLHCTECTAPDGRRHTRQTHILESTGTSGPTGRPGQISLIWGTEGREFKSPQPDNENRRSDDISGGSHFGVLTVMSRPMSRFRRRMVRKSPPRPTALPGRIAVWWSRSAAPVTDGQPTVILGISNAVILEAVVWRACSSELSKSIRGR
jgi:hypothetical protein